MPKHGRKKLSRYEGRSSIAGAVPDRSQALIGTYAPFLRVYRVDGKIVALRGQSGLIVRDTMGRCKPGECAVITGQSKALGYDYVVVPLKRLKLIR